MDSKLHHDIKQENELQNLSNKNIITLTSINLHRNFFHSLLLICYQFICYFKKAYPFKYLSFKVSVFKHLLDKC